MLEVTMDVPRHLIGSDPDVQIASSQPDGDLPRAVHIDARPPCPVTHVQQEAKSIVITEPRGLSMSCDAADVTQTIRPRAHSSTNMIAWVEEHWVPLAVGVAVPLGLLLAFSLLR